ncbi:DUF974 domain-containing protein [Diplogelasinospora grovesii]|uniref:DUF974 domain-containing protein n=1 Tax=Diplogelasinospora grovesii TaxID=303347 RepID=A0AAN6S9M7_9PEZI|nr:DUF974 domain-containing protein [Diplogelasinospora grovesii]
MSHQRYPSHDAVKEPHSVSLKVLRLSRPSLVTQYPIPPPPPSLSPPSNDLSRTQSPLPASLAYTPSASAPSTNPDSFILSPILNLPPSFGSAYVGETFSCTLCANHDVPPPPDGPVGPRKTIRDVRIEAEMKTPTSATVTKLTLTSDAPSPTMDLEPGETLQKVVNFDLKEEGNHVLAVTVSYYEATDVSGRTRTFRKLYQFICRASIIVRHKPGLLPPKRIKRIKGGMGRRWVLEAQLENCSEDAMRLDRVVLDTEPGLTCTDCNYWETNKGGDKPVLHPGEVEQVCFVVEEREEEEVQVQEQEDGRIILGVLGIGWRGEMGNRGFLSTGKLGTRHGGKGGITG